MAPITKDLWDAKIKQKDCITKHCFWELDFNDVRSYILNKIMKEATNVIIGFLAFAFHFAPLHAQPPRPPRPSGPDCVIKKDEVPNGQGIPVTLNGDASCKASSGRPDRVRLTDDAPNQAGSAYTTSIFRNTDYFPFESFFEYEIIPGQDETVADGIAFVIHFDPDGVEAISSVGGGLGIYNGYPESGPGGIRNALIIEIDTFFNEGPFPPFSTNQYARAIDVIVTDDEGYATRVHEEDISLTIPWSNRGKVWISHSISSPYILDIYFGGQYTDPRPSNPLVSFNLSEYLEQPDSNVIFCGFSASTGGESSIQEIVCFTGCGEITIDGDSPLADEGPSDGPDLLASTLDFPLGAELTSTSSIEASTIDAEPDAEP